MSQSVQQNGALITSTAGVDSFVLTPKEQANNSYAGTLASLMVSLASNKESRALVTPIPFPTPLRYFEHVHVPYENVAPVNLAR